ncbi:MAG: hypothetical protein OXH15_15970 [Gammaproteobacteria bacterium]|nr:hypothetical protein [Gammaproteobacteria bacterium]
MGFWSFVAFAVACGCLLEAYRIYAKSKSGRRSDADLEARVVALEDENDLEVRVRNLEAIITDPKFQLDREINKLSN